MNKYTTYIGMDVHARSITAKGIVLETGETFSRRFGAEYGAAEIAEWLSKLPQPVHCAYESGCTGVWLARRLRELGYDCDIVAISTLERSVKDRQQKCDKHDAEVLRAALLNPASKHTTVWLPTKEQEGRRELSRLSSSVRDELKRKKQALISFLLRHGFVWCEKTKTGRPKQPKGRAWDAWLSSISFNDPATQRAFLEYRRRIKEAEDESKRIQKLLSETFNTPQTSPVTDALRCLFGIDTTTALTIQAEFGDFERFSGGRKVSSWAGLVPKNNSSGDHECKGSITHAGNKYVRRAIVEAVSSSSCWKHPYKAPPKDVDVAPHILAMAKKANARLYERSQHLRYDLCKNANEVKVVLANELVRWCWAVGREAQRYIANNT